MALRNTSNKLNDAPLLSVRIISPAAIFLPVIAAAGAAGTAAANASIGPSYGPFQCVGLLAATVGSLLAGSPKGLAQYHFPSLPSTKPLPLR